MCTWIVIGVLGFSALHSNSSSVTDFVKETSTSFFEAVTEPIIKYPKEGYLNEGYKEIKWSEPEKLPKRISFEQIKNSKKQTPHTSVEIRKGGLNIESKPTNNTYSAKQEAVDDLGILSDKSENIIVNTDEILSLLEKTPKKIINREGGAFVIPNQTVKPNKEENRDIELH